MDKLVRIKSLDNYRFFKGYRWNNSLKPFGKYNIIYGWNGCGKSTLSDFFAAIEKGEQLPPQCNFQLCFQETGQPENTVTAHNTSTIASRFKVYHQHYAQGLISHPDSICHISIIGHDEGKAAAQIEELKKEKSTWEDTLTNIQSSAASIKREFEGYRRERANLVRTLTQYSQAYNYNKIYERYKEIKAPIELSQAEYDNLSVAVRATQKSVITEPKATLLVRQSCDDILKVLLESPVYTTIEKLQQDVRLRNWVQQGFEIHKNDDVKVCEFCHNPIRSEHWNALENYFSDSLTKFKSKIASTLGMLENCKGQFEQLKVNLPHATQFFDEFSVEYQQLQEQAIALCETYLTFLTKAIHLVGTKGEKIIDSQCATEFEALISAIDFDYSAIAKISSLIKKHNTKADHFAKSIEADKVKLEIHVIAQSAVAFTEYEKQLESNSELQREAIGKISSLKSKIIELDNKVKDSRIPAETINTDISFIFGHSDLRFEWKENGYEIRRNDEIACDLSTGEQNAIALIYFFNTLQDSSVSKDNCIVILDDPVSSFDSNYYYSAAAYIRDKLERITQAFILTHKFTLYKDFARMFSGSHRYLLERDNNNPAIKEEDAFLRDYEDEYVYLFSKIYRFIKNPPGNFQDYLMYPNMGRRLLESFIAFKLPEKYAERDVLTRAIEMDGADNTARIRALTRLVQNQSHLRRVGVHDGVDNILDIKQLPNIFKHLLAFIEKHDPIHYSTLIKQVDPEVENDDSLIEEPPVRIIPLYDLPVSAGFGNRLDDYEPYENYETTSVAADFALRISGDSMEPQICHGDIVLVKKQGTIDNANIGIAVVEREVFCKKIITTGKAPLLVSLNKDKYPPRAITSDERIDILGKVIDVIKPE